MESPKISVCIPNFNYARYLREAIDSVLAQTWPVHEIIVADNASTDDSVAVVESYSDKRIRLIRNRYNIGFSHNLDRATERATGDYMLLLSADDRMKPQALSTYVNILKSHPDIADSMLLVAEADSIDGNGGVTGRLRREPGAFLYFFEAAGERGGRPPANTYEIYPGSSIIPTVVGNLTTVGPFLSLMYPRRLYEAVEGYHNVHSVDPDASFAHKLLFTKPYIAYVDAPLFEYRRHDSNQASIERNAMSIKHPIDKYLYTVEYPNSLLEANGLSRDTLVSAFVTVWGLQVPTSKLVSGSWREAARLFLFAAAAHPSRLFRDPRSYLLLTMLLTGPLAPFLARLGVRARRAVVGRRYGRPPHGRAPVPIHARPIPT